VLQNKCFARGASEEVHQTRCFENFLELDHGPFHSSFSEVGFNFDLIINCSNRYTSWGIIGTFGNEDSMKQILHRLRCHYKMVLPFAVVHTAVLSLDLTKNGMENLDFLPRVGSRASQTDKSSSVNSHMQQLSTFLLCCTLQEGACCWSLEREKGKVHKVRANICAAHVVFVMR